MKSAEKLTRRSAHRNAGARLALLLNDALVIRLVAEDRLAPGYSTLTFPAMTEE
jgi:hypothetical protein